MYESKKFSLICSFFVLFFSFFFRLTDRYVIKCNTNKRWGSVAECIALGKIASRDVNTISKLCEKKGKF